MPPQRVLFTPPNNFNSENAFKRCDVVPCHGDQRGYDHAKAAAEHLNNKQVGEHGAVVLAGKAYALGLPGKASPHGSVRARITSSAAPRRKRPQFNALHFDVYSF